MAKIDPADSVPQADEPCERLDWDSTFWGIPIARARVGKPGEDAMIRIDEWCIRNATRCLYLLGAAEDPETTAVAERHGFRLVDTRLTFTHHSPKEASGRDLGAETPPIRRSRGGDVPYLREIAGTSHRDTRFYADPGFPDDRCDALYRTWIENSHNGYADVVLVAVENETPVGYISCHLHGEIDPGTIGLVGVHEDRRGRGIGVALVRSAIAWFAENRSPAVEVVTQRRNAGAQRLYKKCGFILDSARPWFHKWYPLPEAQV